MFTMGDFFSFAIAFIGILLTILNIVDKIIAWKDRSKEPQVKIIGRIETLELWKIDVDQKLEADRKHFDKIDEGSKYTQRALLALMDAALSEGGNKTELRNTRDMLYEYLSEK